MPSVLAALAAQTLRGEDWSVLVVDNGSTDGTAEQVGALWSRADVALRVVHEPRPGIALARQRALTECHREFLCFCDDDNLLAADYLEQASVLLGRLGQAGALGGQGFPEANGPFPGWFAAAAGGYAVGPQANAEGPVSDSRGYLYGAGMIIRVGAWRPIAAAGFELKLKSRSGTGMNSGEDNEICLLLRLAGWELHYSPRLVFRHMISARKLEEAYCRSLYRGFGEAVPILNVYRDFLMGRASVALWRPWAMLRVLQGWLARGRDWLIPRSPAAVSALDLEREIAHGFAAGCRLVGQRGGILPLYGEIAGRLAGLRRQAA